jgi:thioredoxin 1|tara:strand:+ start:314 stop:577 length:264 start_codon:yes stop_codon:yes gene_type:complete
MEIIKFSAEWCGPCKAYKNIFDKVVSEYSNISVIEADVDKDNSITVKYGIRSVPTTIIVKNDVELDRITGIILDKDLKSIIDKYVSI